MKLDADGAVIVDEYSQSSVRIHLRDRRRDQSHESHAGRDSRRPCVRRHRLQQAPDAGGSQQRAERGVRPAADRLPWASPRSDARRSHDAVDIYRTSFRPMRTMLAGNEERTLMKLVVDGETDQLLGVHIAGEDAPEMIQLAAIAVKAGHHQEAVGQHRGAASDGGGRAGADAREGRGARQRKLKTRAGRPGLAHVTARDLFIALRQLALPVRELDAAVRRADAGRRRTGGSRRASRRRWPAGFRDIP